MPRSILDAIRQGEWNFEPAGQATVELDATTAMPGTQEKVDILAQRLRLGLPLWHPSDRRSYSDADED